MNETRNQARVEQESVPVTQEELEEIALEIPQYGTKHSLNVSVSLGIVLWELHRGRG